MSREQVRSHIDAMADGLRALGIDVQVIEVPDTTPGPKAEPLKNLAHFKVLIEGDTPDTFEIKKKCFPTATDGFLDLARVHEGIEQDTPGDLYFTVLVTNRPITKLVAEGPDPIGYTGLPAVRA